MPLQRHRRLKPALSSIRLSVVHAGFGLRDAASYAPKTGYASQNAPHLGVCAAIRDIWQWYLAARDLLFRPPGCPARRTARQGSAWESRGAAPAAVLRRFVVLPVR